MRVPLLLGCLILLAGAAYIPKDVRKKPGKCPHVADINRQCPLPSGVQNSAAFNDFLMSIAECLFDGDCKGADKCCFDGCKTKCTSVAQWKRDEFPAGKCPPVDISRVSNCKYVDDPLMHHECSKDTECKKNEKCCFDGCLVKCVDVSKQSTRKPGKCPSVSFADGQKCTDASTGGTSANEIPQDSSHCKNDADCNGTEKCCSDGCNLKCYPAVFLKESDITAENEERRRGEPNTPVTMIPKDAPKIQSGDITLGGETFIKKAIHNPHETVPRAESLTPELERAFVLVKPDGVRRGLISNIMSRFERKGYKLVAMKLLQPTKSLLRKHYSNLQSKYLVQDILEYLGPGPVVAMVWQGIQAVDGAKRVLGASGLLTAAPGTVRFDFSAHTSRDIVHGSENLEQASKEIRLWFSDKEIFDWDPL